MSKSQIVLESSLQIFFYDLLQEINKKSTTQLPNEAIFYSSLVMDKYGDSRQFFEKVDGKIREKILGVKLLEAASLSPEKRRVTIKDVAETSLLVCGFFSDSLNRKIIDVKYYQELGIMAYSQLNAIEPKAYNINSFYKLVANKFTNITSLMNLAAIQSAADKDQAYLIISKLVS